MEEAEQQLVGHHRLDSNETNRTTGYPKTKKHTTVAAHEGCGLRSATSGNSCSLTGSSDGVNPLFLEALRIFFLSENDTGTRSPWLDSTKPLSVASLRTCEEFREATAFHVRVTDDTPRSLWIARTSVNGHKFQSRTADDDLRCPNAGGALIEINRVPAAKVVKLTWEKSSADEIKHFCAKTRDASSKTLGTVGEIVFGDTFNENLSGVAWPEGVQCLTFGCSFNQPLHDVSWPPGLLELSFGRSFDKPINGVTWPRTLQVLLFGHAFSLSCAGVVWPESLRELTFGHGYSHPLTGIVWPASLERLSLGRKFNHPIHSSSGIDLPPALRTLTLGWHFDQCLKGVALPRTLEVLCIAGVYNRPLDEVEFPTGLRKLTLGGHFNQPLDAVRWPELLEEVSFGWAFNQPLLSVAWPPHLSKLSLGYRFNQPPARVKWPEALEELDLGVFSRQSLEGFVWPPTFRLLTVSRAFDTTGVVLPKGSRVCRRGHTYRFQRGLRQWYNAITSA